MIEHCHRRVEVRLTEATKSEFWVIRRAMSLELAIQVVELYFQPIVYGSRMAAVEIFETDFILFIKIQSVGCINVVTKTAKARIVTDKDKRMSNEKSVKVNICHSFISPATFQSVL